jgi:hypothetical protein
MRCRSSQQASRGLEPVLRHVAADEVKRVEQIVTWWALRIAWPVDAETVTPEDVIKT